MKSVHPGDKRRIEMRNEGPSCGSCSAMSAFFLGGIIGAGVALLVAPRAGKETRQQIMGAAEGAKGKAEDYYKQVKETVTSALEHGKGVVAEKKEHIAKAVQEGIDAYKRED
jgi:gas vesicle protein